jgi:DNA-binding response OmpR family regulator
MTEQDALRLLLVDDDPDLTELMGEVLATSGFDVAICDSVPDALGYVQRGVDAVITDVTLAGDDDGLVLCERVKSEHPDTVVFVLSGDRSAERDAVRLGADGFWLKPVDLGLVAASVRDHAKPPPTG